MPFLAKIDDDKHYGFRTFGKNASLCNKKEVKKSCGFTKERLHFYLYLAQQIPRNAVTQRINSICIEKCEISIELLV